MGYLAQSALVVATSFCPTQPQARLVPHVDGQPLGGSLLLPTRWAPLLALLGDCQWPGGGP